MSYPTPLGNPKIGIVRYRLLVRIREIHSWVVEESEEDTVKSQAMQRSMQQQRALSFLITSGSNGIVWILQGEGSQ